MFTPVTEMKKVFFSDGATGILGKTPRAPLQETNPPPSDYQFGCSATEQWETREMSVPFHNIIPRSLARILLPGAVLNYP